ncbi:MAG: hypothetical protein V4723_21560 [Pseudomonadota bacterium]
MDEIDKNTRLASGEVFSGKRADRSASTDAHAIAKERRSDLRLAQVVELSLQIDAALGRKAAESFLWNRLVPYEVSLRVFFCAEIRRDANR